MTNSFHTCAEVWSIEMFSRDFMICKFELFTSVTASAFCGLVVIWWCHLKVSFDSKWLITFEWQIMSAETVKWFRFQLKCPDKKRRFWLSQTDENFFINYIYLFGCLLDVMKDENQIIHFYAFVSAFWCEYSQKIYVFFQNERENLRKCTKKSGGKNETKIQSMFQNVIFYAIYLMKWIGIHDFRSNIYVFIDLLQQIYFAFVYVYVIINVMMQTHILSRGTGNEWKKWPISG